MKKLIALSMLVASFGVAAESHNLNCEGRNVVYSISDLNEVSITVDSESYPVGRETLRQQDPNGNGTITMQSAANMKNKIAAIFVTDVSLMQRKAWLMVDAGNQIECNILN